MACVCVASIARAALVLFYFYIYIELFVLQVAIPLENLRLELGERGLDERGGWWWGGEMWPWFCAAVLRFGV